MNGTLNADLIDVTYGVTLDLKKDLDIATLQIGGGTMGSNTQASAVNVGTGVTLTSTTGVELGGAERAREPWRGISTSTAALPCWRPPPSWSGLRLRHHPPAAAGRSRVGGDTHRRPYPDPSDAWEKARLQPPSRLAVRY